MTELNKGMKILVIDDYSTMRRIISNILIELELKNIDEAEDGAVALRMIKEKQYDLVLIDWNMPKMSGIDFLIKAREMESYKKTVMFLVTAEALKENILAAVKAGASDYIVKPFNEKTLEHKIKRAFGIPE